MHYNYNNISIKILPESIIFEFNFLNFWCEVNQLALTDELHEPKLFP